jgi:hypothetical protein
MDYFSDNVDRNFYGDAEQHNCQCGIAGDVKGNEGFDQYHSVGYLGISSYDRTTSSDIRKII